MEAWSVCECDYPRRNDTSRRHDIHVTQTSLYRTERQPAENEPRCTTPRRNDDQTRQTRLEEQLTSDAHNVDVACRRAEQTLSEEEAELTAARQREQDIIKQGRDIVREQNRKLSRGTIYAPTLYTIMIASSSSLCPSMP